MSIPVPAAPLDAGPRLHGVFDLVRPDRVAGWAIDRASAAATARIEIRREGRLVATVAADRHRADLVKGGVGTGNYGFSAALDPPVEPGFEFTVTVTALAADGARAPIRRGGKSSPTTEQRLLERIFEEVTRPAPPAPAPPDLGQLAVLLDRVELTQHRLEAALAAIPSPGPSAPHRDLRRILFVTLTFALGVLGTGLYSLFLT